MSNISAICEALASGRYSACDVSDILVSLHVPQGGYLLDIVPIPMPRPAASKPLVAPVSTILFVPNQGPLTSDPATSNIPHDKHFTDMPAPGSIALLQQPEGLITAVLGDIMASRLFKRGVRGVVTHGRVRDIGPIGHMCATDTTSSTSSTSSAPVGSAAPSVTSSSGTGSSAPFAVWSRGNSTVGPALQCKAWCADVPLRLGELTVRAGDLLFADETERGVVVIPQDLAATVAEKLPQFKDTDDLRVADVQAGKSIIETVRAHH